MTVLRRALPLMALALALAAAIVALLPIDATGVRGSAVAPRYHDFYFGFTGMTGQHPSVREAMHRAGIQPPRDVVEHRRYLAYGLGFGGAAVVLLLVTDELLRRRRPSTG